VHFQYSSSLCCCARLQFAVCFSAFFGGVGQSSQGCADLSVAGGMLCDAMYLPIWSVECLTGRFGASSSSCGGGGSPQVFSV
jgi:hypothetical protein